MRISLCILLSALTLSAAAQVLQYPYTEQFDTVAVPALPSGWGSTTARSAGGDFTTTRSAPYSDSVAVISTNATIAQALTSPLLDLSTWEAGELTFYERRSGTHTSGVLIEGSTDGGATFLVPLSDTLTNPGTTSYVRRTLSLAPLGNAARARIRWRILGNGSGTTGTYRLDDVRIDARARLDLELLRMASSPAFPVAGVPASIAATIRNAGLDAAAAFIVEFFRDLDHDTLPGPDELFASEQVVGPLAPGDSVVVTAVAGGGAPGTELIIGRVSMPGDQNGANDLSRFALAFGLPRGAVVVNEIMYAPRSPEPEWVELASTIDDTVLLSRWRISDHNTLTQYTSDTGTWPLPPHGFVVVTKDAARFLASHPGTPGILPVASMPSSLWNNDSDAVVLFDDRGAVMDSVPYSAHWGGTGGFSLERIEPSGPSAGRANWGTCGADSGSTPGAQNFLTPLDTNMRAVGLVVARSTDSLAVVALTVRNIGRTPVDRYGADLFYDRDGDSAPAAGERVASAAGLEEILPGDSTTLLFPWEHPVAGEDTLLAVVSAEHDMRRSDDTVRRALSFSFPRRSLVVNEIMYEPSTGRSEYVELFNPSQAAIDIAKWKLVKGRDSAALALSRPLADAPSPLLPGEYLVVASDSSILAQFPGVALPGSHLIVPGRSLGLRNQGDTVMIVDRTGRAIDSIVYAPSWHNADLEETRGRSLERINALLPGNDPRNWSTCADPSGGTPGRHNSLFTPEVAIKEGLTCAPNPFSPDGDGFEDVVMIGYLLPFPSGTLRLTIYDSRGRVIRRLAGGEPTGAIGQIPWDGLSDRHERVPIGIYVVLLEAHDAAGTRTETLKGVVVVATRL